MCAGGGQILEAAVSLQPVGGLPQSALEGSIPHANTGGVCKKGAAQLLPSLLLLLLLLWGYVECCQVMCNCKRLLFLVAAPASWSGEECRVAVCGVLQQQAQAWQAASHVGPGTSRREAKAWDFGSRAGAWAPDFVAVQTGTLAVNSSSTAFVHIAMYTFFSETSRAK